MATHTLLFTGDAGDPRVVLAHGAGAPMDSPFMEVLAAGLAGRGVCVIRFEFPYMVARRETGTRRGPNPQRMLLDTWRAVVEQVGGPGDLVIGGKSMGGRMASMVADEVGVRGLVCLGYPFHPPGRPETLRTAHLKTLRTPTLVVQGDRDPFGKPDEVATYGLASTIQLCWLPDGDHSFKPRVRSGYTVEEHLATCADAVAAFVHAL